MKSATCDGHLCVPGSILISHLISIIPIRLLSCQRSHPRLLCLLVPNRNDPESVNAEDRNEPAQQTSSPRRRASDLANSPVRTAPSSAKLPTSKHLERGPAEIAAWRSFNNQPIYHDLVKMTAHSAVKENYLTPQLLTSLNWPSSRERVSGSFLSNGDMRQERLDGRKKVGINKGRSDRAAFATQGIVPAYLEL